MENFNKKLYITALVLSIVAVCLLIAGMITCAVVGNDGLIPLIVLSVTAVVCAVAGIVILCIDIKSKNKE